MKRYSRPKQVLAPAPRRRKFEHWLNRHERQLEEHQTELIERLERERRAKAGEVGAKP